MCNTYTHDVFRLQRHVTFAVIYEIKFCMQTVCYSKESNGSLYIYIYPNQRTRSSVQLLGMCCTPVGKHLVLI